MTDFADSAAAMRARFEEFEAERQRARPEHEEREQPHPATRSSDRRSRRALRRSPRRDPRIVRSETPQSDRRRADNDRIHAIKDRKPGHPLGTIAEPLPMGPHKSPNTLAALREARRA